MIGFGILSFGLYFPLWFLRRRTALNALHSGRKLQLWPFSLAFAIQTVTIVMAFGGLPTLEGYAARGRTVAADSASASAS